MSAIIISAAFLATAAIATNPGIARVVNACNYNVKLCNVPAANGGYDQIDKTLAPNDTYEQTFTQLTNGMGWSIKLSKDQTLDNIMQYEYTYHPGEPIWYDLSDVNGNPWDGDWEITSAGSCTPKQSAYRYATDDAYGMQSCPADSVITVTLCSGESQNDVAASSASVSASSVAATVVSSAAPTTTPSAIGASSVIPSVYSSVASSVAPSVATSSAVFPSSYGHGRVAESSAAPSSTTFATSAVVASSSEDAPEPTYAPDAVWVTEIATAFVTEVVTATAYYDKRDEHVKRHAHHPHMRA